jgi:SulP family sulfate permease
MAGIILVVAAVLRAGSLVRYIPEAVINGFTLGIAAIIAVSQIKDFVGLSVAHDPADFIEKVAALWAARDSFNVSAFAVALVTVVLIVAFRRAAPKLPGLVVAVILTSAAAPLLGLEVATIGSRFGGIPSSLPTPTLPDLSPGRLIELLPSAMIIAFLAGVESLLSAIVADRMIGGRHRPNTEVLAQGVANLGSALSEDCPRQARSRARRPMSAPAGAPPWRAWRTRCSFWLSCCLPHRSLHIWRFRHWQRS